MKNDVKFSICPWMPWEWTSYCFFFSFLSITLLHFIKGKYYGLYWNTFDMMLYTSTFYTNCELFYLRVSCLLFELGWGDTGNTGDTSLATFGDTYMALVGSAVVICTMMKQTVNTLERLILFIPWLIVRIFSKILYCTYCGMYLFDLKWRYPDLLWCLLLYMLWDEWEM